MWVLIINITIDTIGIYSKPMHNYAELFKQIKLNLILIKNNHYKITNLIYLASKRISKLNKLI